MATNTLLYPSKQVDFNQYLKNMDDYINDLKSRPKKVAKKEATAALKRMGLLTDEGKEKDTIVSWE